MKITKNSCAILCGVATLLSQAAFADIDPGATSGATNRSLYEKVSDKMILNYWGMYRGAALSNPGNGLTPLPDGGPDSSTPQGIENIITTAYKFDANTSLGVLTHFYYYPGLKPEDTSATFQFYDPIIQFEKKNIINSNGFRLTGRLWLDLPLSPYDRLRQDKDLFAVSTIGILSYDVPKTALTVGLFGYLRAYIGRADMTDTARTYKVYIAPNASYQISKTVSATLWVDLIQGTRSANSGFITGFSNYAVDIQPGINWDITKNISFNPFLNIYPGALTLQATSIQATLTAKAF